MKQDQTVEPMSATAPTTSKNTDGFLNSVSVYWLELVITMIVSIIVGWVVAVSCYALFSVLSGGSSAGYGSLWMAASALVWVPLAAILYARVRGYEHKKNDITNSSPQRTLTIIYQVIMLATAIGFALATVYSLLTVLAGSSDIVSALVQTTAPSLINAIWFGFLYTAFFRRPWLGRRVFIFVLIGGAAVIVIPSIVTSIINIRSTSDYTNTRDNNYTNHDRRYENDRRSNRYYQPRDSYYYQNN